MIELDVKQQIDLLDGDKSSDLSGVENRIFEVFNDLDPEKRHRAIQIFLKIDKLNSFIQGEQLKINLLEGIEGGEIKKEDLVEKLNGLYGKKNRYIQLLTTKNKGTEKQKEILKNVTNVDKIPAKDLLKLEKEEKGFLSKTFAYKQIKDDQGNISEEPVDINNINEGDKIVIDFGKNKSAYKKIGGGDILPSNIKVVKIIDTNGAERIGVRGIQNDKVGYYDAQGYIPIYNGYTIEIPKKDEAENVIKNTKDYKETSEKEEEEAKDQFIKKIEQSDNYSPDGDYMGIYGKNIIGETIKDLPLEKTIKLLKQIFGEGTGTDLLIALDGGKGVAIKRMIALGFHENQFNFGHRKDYATVSRGGKIVKDYNSTDIGTFQIHDKTKELTEKKYSDCIKAGLRIAKGKGINTEDINSHAQKDLIAHLGFIGEQKFDELRDDSMSDEEVINLMTSIQGGVRDIGVSVVKQINTFKAVIN